MLPTAKQAGARERAAASRQTAKNVDELLRNVADDWTRPQGKRVREVLEMMPETSRATYLKAMLGKSATAGIKAHCMECVGWLRDEVRNCTSTACPLYTYRPFK